MYTALSAVYMFIYHRSKEKANLICPFLLIKILIYRFNPFRRVKFTSLDAKITFSAGLFLLGTTAIDGIIKNYLSTIEKYIKKFVDK